jgi:hypothetical protein
MMDDASAARAQVRAQLNTGLDLAEQPEAHRHRAPSRLLWSRRISRGALLRSTGSARSEGSAFASALATERSSGSDSIGTEHDDRFRRQAIVPRRPGRRSLSSPGRRAAGYRFGDEALVRIEPDLRRGAPSKSPRSDRRENLQQAPHDTSPFTNQRPPRRPDRLALGLLLRLPGEPKR